MKDDSSLHVLVIWALENSYFSLFAHRFRNYMATSVTPVSSLLEQSEV